MFDGRTGEEIGPALETPSPIEGLAFHPDRRFLVTGHRDGHVRGWDLDSREPVYDGTFQAGVFPASTYTPELRFSPDGRRLSLSTCSYAQVSVVAWPSGQLLWQSEGLGGRGGERVGLRWSRDGSRLWFGFESGATSLLHADLRKGGKAQEFLRGQPPAVSEDGLAVAITGGGLAAIDSRSARALWRR
jgi:WD40 repeat protein